MIPAPKTGRVVINNIDTKNIDQIIKSQFKLLIPEFRLNWRVAKKVIAPASDEAPKKCKLRIAKDTVADVEKSAPERGLYKVHPAETHLQTQLQLQIFVLQKRIIKKQGYSI